MHVPRGLETVPHHSSAPEVLLAFAGSVLNHVTNGRYTAGGDLGMISTIAV